MEKKYKKIIVFLGICITLMFAMVFIGCSKKDTENVNDTEQINTEELGTEEISTEEVSVATETEELEADSSQETQATESVSNEGEESGHESKTETTTDNSMTNNDTSVSETPAGSTNDSNADSGSTNESNSESDAVTSTTPESSTSGFQTGTYRGGHKIEAMGAELPYTYSMNFKDDGTYLYQVSFVVGGETYSEEESGTYTVSGSSITMTSSAGVATSGSYSDGKVTITRRVSTFASEDATITLQ